MSAATPRVGQSLPLLVHVEAETWLADRLQQHGCDIYAGGPYEHHSDRLAAAITTNGMASVIVGRKDGKPETYAACFERICGRPLVPNASRKVATP